MWIKSSKNKKINIKLQLLQSHFYKKKPQFSILIHDLMLLDFKMQNNEILSKI